MVSAPKPEEQVQYWDPEVDRRRVYLLHAFMERVKHSAKLANPAIHDPYVEEARSKFCTVLELALQVALSKFNRIIPTETLLGLRGLQGVKGLEHCAACARPFAKDAGPGDQRSVDGSRHTGHSIKHSSGASLAGSSLGGMPLGGGPGYKPLDMTDHGGGGGDNSTIDSGPSLAASYQSRGAGFKAPKKLRARGGGHGGGHGGEPLQRTICAVA